MAALGQGYCYPYDPCRSARVEAPQECWNPHGGHFERVRPGEIQNDLDFSRCRVIGAYDPYWRR